MFNELSSLVILCRCLWVILYVVESAVTMLQQQQSSQRNNHSGNLVSLSLCDTVYYIVYAWDSRWINNKAATNFYVESQGAVTMQQQQQSYHDLYIVRVESSFVFLLLFFLGWVGKMNDFSATRGRNR